MLTDPDDPHGAVPYRPEPLGSRRAAWRRVWGETWRLAVALAFSLVALGGMLVEAEAAHQEVPEAQIALDLLVGLVCCGLVLLRRRWPTTVALLVTAASAVSVFAVGPITLAVVSLATHRRWWRIVAVGAVFVVGGWTYERLYPPVEQMGWPVTLGGGVVLYSLMVWIGAYIGLRREYLAGLHERLATAEREQASRVAQARANERALIAREMHDVLAHRMSLVAMHAGALAYRTDLPPEQVAESAALVRDSAHEALGELREVLGVLRGLDGPAPDGAPVGSTGPGAPERPQPTLAELPALARAASDAGTSVRLVDRVTEPEALPTAVSRTAYRIVQETLTNVRKHAPGLPASVVLRGARGQGLWVTVTNPTVVDARGAPAAPPSGLGLLGLTERAELAGGSLIAHEAEGRFVVRAWLPWDA
ncbi:histidine kinase [Isoptericola halotolerans]|uniref:sensor histidine kinase n=1 Tax=Isoptericola halotolerans TaxID=300560 RepID=UPI00388D639D